LTASVTVALAILTQLRPSRQFPSFINNEWEQGLDIKLAKVMLPAVLGYVNIVDE
jgi:hypothetical protein